MIPVMKRWYERVHLRCEGWHNECKVVIEQKIQAFDEEDLRERVLDLAANMGWTTDYYILCKDCTIDREQEVRV